MFAALLTLLILPVSALAQDVTAKVTDDRSDPKATLRLSESLRATLSFEGPSPLRVELPKQVLDPITDRDWKVRPLGPPTVAPVGDRREKWSQSFHLSPYVPGDALPVVFAAVRVNGREVPTGGFEVRVVSTVSEAKPEAARPVTGIEELPPPPEMPAVSTAPVWWAVGGLVAGFVLALAWRLRPRTPPPSPAERTRSALDRLERTRSGAELAEGLAAAVRAFIDTHIGIPASRLTTPELLAAAQQAGRPVEETDTLRGILDRCDRAKFAGDVPDDDGCRELLARCRQWLDDVSPPGTGPR